MQAGARLARTSKYWMLGMVMAVAAVTGIMAYELVNPVSMLHRGIIFGMGVGWLLIVGIFLFDLFVAKRGWCTHLCPMGAFYALLGKFSPLRVRADERGKCDDCAECYAVCPESQIIPPVLKKEEKGVAPVILSGECTNCGRCIDICGREVFEFGWRNLKYGAAPGDVASAAQLKQQE
jgi:ferredoxin-type protein NapH